MPLPGAVFRSPYPSEFTDSQGRVLSISVAWDDDLAGNTRNILSAQIHRDVGCKWATVIFANPTDVLLRKDLPPAPEGDTTMTAQQVRQRTGFRTIDDMLAAGQITASE
jgi:hypothetical protein